MFRHPRDIVVWLVWFLTYSIGWGICFALLSISAIATVDYDATARSIFPADLIDFVLFHGIIWSGIGVTQWVVLRIGYLPRVVWWSPWWVLVTVVGWVCFWLMTYAVTLQVNIWGMLIVWIPASMLIGLLEWFVLRRYIAESIIWLYAHPTALMSMVFVYSGMGSLQLRIFGGDGSTIVLLLSIVLPGIVYGSVISFFLVFLLQRLNPQYVLANYSHYQPGK